ncbi:ribonuclease 3 drosha [Glossina fuscipes fuscipes]
MSFPPSLPNSNANATDNCYAYPPPPTPVVNTNTTQETFSYGIVTNFPPPRPPPSTNVTKNLPIQTSFCNPPPMSEHPKKSCTSHHTLVHGTNAESVHSEYYNYYATPPPTLHATANFNYDPRYRYPTPAVKTNENATYQHYSESADLDYWSGTYAQSRHYSSDNAYFRARRPRDIPPQQGRCSAPFGRQGAEKYFKSSCYARRDLDQEKERDDRSVKPETERERLLKTWRSNYCETPEEIQRKLNELAELDEHSSEIWIRYSPAEPYYRKTETLYSVTATPRLQELCKIFDEALIQRASRIRNALPPYKPPNRKPRRRLCKHKSEVCSSSDTGSSDNDEYQIEQDCSMEELSRKLQHPYRIHPDLWHNDPGEMNDGPLCRCSAKSRRIGIRHGIYPGENGYPKCDLNSNNAKQLYHYRITISPPTNFLTKTPTIIKHDEHEFLFEGFSLFSHFPLVDLPTCKVIRFNIEYTILYIPERMPENFTIRELDLFFKYLFHELLELVDFSLLPKLSTLAEVETSCPAFHFMPRFVRDLPDNGKEVLAMCEVLRYLLDNAGPLVDDRRLRCLNSISQHEWQDYVDDFRGMLVTKPGYKPCSVRVDQLDRNVSDLPECRDAESGLTHPAIVHFGIRPPQLSYAGNPEYQKAWREYVKFRHLMANMSKPSFKDKRKLEEKEARLQEMRTQGRMKRNVTVAVNSKGYHRTGIMCDIVQHALFAPVLTGHLRFHKSLDLLEKTIAYKFKNRYLLQLALTHPSYKENYGTNPDHARNSLTNCGIRQPEYGDRKIHYMNTRKRGINTLINIMSRFGKEYETMSNITHNERLEFLGDAVVEFLSSIHLFFMFPELEEGGLATYRAAIVQNQHLALLAKKLHLEEYMLYAHGSDLCHELELRHAMANCFEALMGALLLDGGISIADEVFMNALFMENNQLREIWKNYPEHPLQEQEPLGDRAYIASYPVLQELTKFEDSIGIKFKHIRLLARAFTDRSIGFTHLTLGSNQRLEFLGDTVLQLICSEYLYRHFPEHHEGHLSLLRSSLVNNRTQAVVCDDLGMTTYAVYSNPKAELKTKDRADLLEAFLGALYVDKGLLYCEQFCHVCLFPRLQIFIMNQDWNDPKSKLQQCCLTLRTMDGGEPDIPIYKVIESSGPTNTRVYTVAVYFRNKRLATATGSSIQQAEMNAAKQALENSRDLFPQLDHQKRVIAKSIKKQTGGELCLEVERSKKVKIRKSSNINPMEDESHLPKQYRLREDISSDELPEDNDIDVEENDGKYCFGIFSTKALSDSESVSSLASVDIPKKKPKYSSEPFKPTVGKTSQNIQKVDICEDVSSDEEVFGTSKSSTVALLPKPNSSSPLLKTSAMTQGMQNCTLTDLKDLVEDISSSSDLEPGELCN